MGVTIQEVQMNQFTNSKRPSQQYNKLDHIDPTNKRWRKTVTILKSFKSHQMDHYSGNPQPNRMLRLNKMAATIYIVTNSSTWYWDSDLKRSFQTNSRIASLAVIRRRLWGWKTVVILRRFMLIGNGYRLLLLHFCLQTSWVLQSLACQNSITNTNQLLFNTTELNQFSSINTGSSTFRSKFEAIYTNLHSPHSNVRFKNSYVSHHQQKVLLRWAIYTSRTQMSKS